MPDSKSLVASRGRAPSAGWFSRLSLLQRLLLLEACVFLVLLGGVVLFTTEFTSSMRTEIEERRLLLAKAVAARVDSQLIAASSTLKLIALSIPPGTTGHAPALDQITGTTRFFVGGVYRSDGTYHVIDSDAGHTFRSGSVLAPSADRVPVNGPAPADVWSVVDQSSGWPAHFLAVATAREGEPGWLIGLVPAEDSWLSQTLALARDLDQTGHADLVTTKGISAASTNLDEIGMADHPDLYRSVSDGSLSTGTFEAEEGHGDHDMHIMSVVPLSAIPWWFALGGSRSETLAPVRTLWLAVLGVTSVVGVLASTFTVLGATRLVRPVKEIGDAARRVADGELKTPIAVNDGGEIGELATAIEAMRSSLADWGEELDSRVGERTAELQVRNRELAATGAVAQAVASTLATAAMLDTAADRIVEHLGVDAVIFFLDRTDRAERSIHSSREARRALTTVDLATCSVVDILQRPAGDPEAETGTLLACLSQHGLSFEGASWTRLDAADFYRCGMVVLVKTGRIPEDAGAVIRLLATEVEIGLRNAALYEGLKDREAHAQALLGKVLGAQEDERSRLARELHDDMAQSLAALIMNLETLGRVATHSPNEVSQIGRLEAAAREMLDSLRRTILALRPSALDDIGLVAAVERMSEQVTRTSGIEVSVKSELGHARLPREWEVAVFRIVQEALSNVVRHSGAKSAGVLLLKNDDSIEVSVTDDGRGIQSFGNEPDPTLLRGVGIEGMRERATLIGGHLTIGGAPGEGTRVLLTVPLARMITGSALRD